jgi:hypothetical protein
MTKASFNLVLNSIVTSTYTGNRSNPTFNVDWKTLIREEDYNKRYHIRFRMKTANDTNVNDQENYRVELYIAGKVFNQSNLQRDFTLGMLSRVNEDMTDGTRLAIDTKPYDNPPITIEGLPHTSSLQLKFIINSTGLEYTAIPNYVFILNFEEI